MKDLYHLLKSRYVLDIFIGDTDFGYITVSPNDRRTIRCALPYLTGAAICDIANKFGYALSYNYKGGLSRWAYMENIIDWCILYDRTSDLLHYLFSKERFVNILQGYSAEETNILYKKIISTVIDKINGHLSFGNNELILVGNSYIVQSQQATIPIETPALNQVSRQYVQQLIERAHRDIANEEYDSAVTKARTLIEEVFCYAIEQKNEKTSDKGDIIKLYNKVKILYNMHKNENFDKRINDLLSGLNKIIDAISGMRNITSDSHGLGVKRISISDYHTRLMVGAAAVFSDFILSVVENSD